jgi:DNA-binding NarL/FixJ family response regulator
METIKALPTVLILAHHSLLSGGIASTLKEYRNIFNVRLIDIDSINFPETIQTESPAIIILDAGDSDVLKMTPVTQLMEWAPNAKIIRLDLSSDRIRIFSSVEFQITHAVDLVSLMRSLSNKELTL